MAGLTQENLNLVVDELKKISQLEERFEKLNQNQKHFRDEIDEIKDFTNYEETEIKKNVISSDDKEQINPNYGKKNIILPDSKKESKVNEGKKIEQRGKNVLNNQIKSFSVIQQKKNTIVSSKFDKADDKRTLDKMMTGTEKKRYELIGTFFAQGAVSEFRRIKKAMQFKEDMSTSSKGFSFKLNNFGFKRKTDNKNKSSFWTNLLKVLGLLGIIAYIFRDKIGDAFPNLKKQILGIVDDLKETSSDILSGVMQYISNSIGKAFTIVVDKLLKETIPSIAGLFFNYTLPDILLRTYLAVLSTISSSAADRLKEVVAAENDDETENVARYVVDNAERQANGGEETQDNFDDGQIKYFEDGQIKYFEELGRSIEDMAKSGAVDKLKIDEYVQNLSLAAWGAVEDTNRSGVQILEDIADKITSLTGEADVNIREMIDRGQFDISNFMYHYKNIVEESKRNGNYDKLDKNSLIVKLLAGEIIKNQEKSKQFTEEKVSQIVKELNLKNDTNATDFVDKLQSQKEHLVQNIKEIVEKQKSEDVSVEEQLEKRRHDNSPVIVTFDEVKNDAYQTEMTKKLTDILTKLSNFLMGNEINLIKIISAGINNVKQFYNNFLTLSITALHDAVRNVGEVVKSTGSVQQPNSQSPSSQGVENQTVNQNNNNIIINVDMGTGSSAALNALSGISSENETIIGTLTATNEELKNVIKAINGVGDMHTVSKKYIDQMLKNDANKNVSISLQTVANIAKHEANATINAKNNSVVNNSHVILSRPNVPIHMTNMVQ